VTDELEVGDAIPAHAGLDVVAVAAEANVGDLLVLAVALAPTDDSGLGRHRQVEAVPTGFVAVPASHRHLGHPEVDVGHVADDDLTMKRVADHLGVSVPGLYHWVKGRDDLLRLAAERALSRVRLPTDTGQHWATWLREWARYTRTVLAERPELLNQFVNGGLD